jgi:2-oxoglutarate ferredoxin oxidoreductase subunit beta
MERLSIMTPWRNGTAPVWCPGCGDHAVLEAVDQALARTGWRPEDVCFVAGIGCSSRLPCSLRGYAFHGAHGRALPVAQGIRLANPKLHVIVTVGDGDALSIGAGHLLHAGRRNPHIACLVLDNAMFGMTKGQPSPTTPRGTRTKTSPRGSGGEPLDPAALALASGATFVGRAATTRREEMADLIAAALAHRGFAFVHLLSPCATFGVKAGVGVPRRAERLPAGGAGLPDRAQAIAAAWRRDPIALGLFWKEERPTLEDEAEAARASAQAGAGAPSLDAILDAYR